MTTKPTRLTDYGDQNFALREAVVQAAKRMALQIYDWPADKTDRYYHELYEGNSRLSLILVHPEGIEPSR